MLKTNKRLLTICLFAISCLLTACGQTGPLYLPGQKPLVYVPHPQPQKQPQQ